MGRIKYAHQTQVTHIKVICLLSKITYAIERNNLDKRTLHIFTLEEMYSKIITFKEAAWLAY